MSHDALSMNQQVARNPQEQGFSQPLVHPKNNKARSKTSTMFRDASFYVQRGETGLVHLTLAFDSNPPACSGRPLTVSLHAHAPRHARY